MTAEPIEFVAPSRFPVGSSPWWLERLTSALADRQARLRRLDDYYRGKQDLQVLAGRAWFESEVAAMFPRFLQANHSKLIVNAVAHRLVVLGFRLGGELRADNEAARIWHANDMEAESDKAHTEALVRGECPVLIEPNPADPATPIITPQDPTQVIVWHAADDRRLRLAALKTWWDEEARRRAYILYLPDWIERWQDRQSGLLSAWLSRGVADGMTWQMVSRERNPLGEVPVVVLPNEPRLRGSPEGEHEPVLSRIDHYNKTLMNMAVTSHELAYPQRFGIGVEAEEETPIIGAAGETLPVLPHAQTGQTRWITTPSPDSSFGQFTAASMDNYIRELDQVRGDIATDTFTPYHFLLSMPSSVPASGEALSTAETALVDKVRGHTRDKGIAWRHVMRIAFRAAGDERRANAMRDEGRVIWADPERRTESQHIDALGKMVQMLGVPPEAAWERIPVMPEEMERWRSMLAETPMAVPVPAPPQSDGVSPAEPPTILLP